MSTPEPVAPRRLKLSTALNAHVLLIVLLTALVAAAAGTVAYLLPTQYVATASVLVQPLDGNPYSPDGQGSDLTRLETEAQVVSSDIIVGAVRQDLPSSFDQPDVTKGLGVTIPTNTQIIQITFRHVRPEVADAVATQYAASFLDYRSERRSAFVDSRRNGIQSRLNNLAKRLKDLRKQGLTSEEPEVKAVGAQLQNLRLQLSTLETSDTKSGEIIVAPEARRSGLSIPVGIAVPAGALLGLLLGAVFAVARERRRDLLRTVDDIEHLGVPVLGHLGAPSAVGEKTASADLPDAALMVAAILTRRVKSPATVAISVLTSGAAEITFPEELAGALTQGQQPVLLVDGAHSTPTRQGGLSEALTSTQELSRLIRKRAGLSRMTVGRKPQAGERLYGTPRMDAMLERASQQFDWVIVHASSTDQTVGRSLVGGCAYWVPVVVLGATSREDLERGIHWARTAGTQPLGVVAIDAQTPSRAWAKTETAPEPSAD